MDDIISYDSAPARSRRQSLLIEKLEASFDELQMQNDAKKTQRVVKSATCYCAIRGDGTVCTCNAPKGRPVLYAIPSAPHPETPSECEVFMVDKVIDQNITPNFPSTGNITDSNRNAMHRPIPPANSSGNSLYPSLAANQATSPTVSATTNLMQPTHGRMASTQVTAPQGIQPPPSQQPPAAPQRPTNFQTNSNWPPRGLQPSQQSARLPRVPVQPFVARQPSQQVPRPVQANVVRQMQPSPRPVQANVVRQMQPSPRPVRANGVRQMQPSQQTQRPTQNFGQNLGIQAFRPISPANVRTAVQSQLCNPETFRLASEFRRQQLALLDNDEVQNQAPEIAQNATSIQAPLESSNSEDIGQSKKLLSLIEARETQQAIELSQQHPNAFSQLINESFENPVEIMNRSQTQLHYSPVLDNNSQLVVPETQEFGQPAFTDSCPEEYYAILDPTSEGRHFEAATPGESRTLFRNSGAQFPSTNEAGEPMEVCSPSVPAPNLQQNLLPPPATTRPQNGQPSNRSTIKQTKGSQRQNFTENQNVARAVPLTNKRLLQTMFNSVRDQAYQEGFAAGMATAASAAPTTNPAAATNATVAANAQASAAPAAPSNATVRPKAAVTAPDKNSKKSSTQQHPDASSKHLKKPSKQEKKQAGVAGSGVVDLSSSDSVNHRNPFHPGYNTPEERHREKYTAAQDRFIITVAKELRRRYPDIQENSMIKRMIRENDIRRTRDSLSKHYRTKLRHVVRQEEITERLRRKNQRLREKLRREKAARDPEYNPNEPSSGSDDDDEPMDVMAVNELDSEEDPLTDSDEDSN